MNITEREKKWLEEVAKMPQGQGQAIFIPKGISMIRATELLEGQKAQIANPRKSGRAPLEIDPEIVRNLAAIQCTMTEIAATVKCSVDTLERRFADIIREGREQGKQSLRRVQWKIAQNNASMAKFLGMQYLGQKDEANNATQYTKIIAERIES